MKLTVYILLLPLILIIKTFGQQVAFPGAEGFGAYTTGGRSGIVYEVTNLNDSGAGSLREGMKKSDCTIVFRVSGYIHLQSALNISGNSITIAGQTAPGDGICVRGYPTIVKGDNIIIRYVRFRLGDENNLKSDAFNINKQSDIIIDHCSISWGVDECASWYDNNNVTIQWSMIGEGLAYADHSMGGLWGGQSSYHHNLIYSCGSRHPKFAYTYDEDITDHRNNVIYNWDYQSAYTSPTGRVNIVANYYKYGPSTDESVNHRIVYSEYDTKRLYVTDNYVFGYPDVTADNWNGGVDGVPIRHDSPFPAPMIRLQSAEEAYESVLEHVGTSLKRDSIDTRVIYEVQNGTGSIISRQSDVGGFPFLQSLNALVDSDHDGMPDTWEETHLLNKLNSSDRNEDPDDDGFTNLEEYLNSLIPIEFPEIPGDDSLPDAPSQLNAVVVSNDQINLEWIDNAVNERGFRIQYSSDDWLTYKEITKALANINDLSVENLDPGITYKFRVRAYNTSGNSEFSNTATATTLSEYHAPIKYDFGPGTLESGYEQITTATEPYSQDTGFGFVNTSGMDQRDRGAPDALREDFIFSEGPRTFKVDLSNGMYSVKIIAGDNLADAPNGPMDIFAEGIKKISGLSSDGGEFSEQSFTVEVFDSQLDLYIVHTNENDGLWRLNGLEISPSVQSTENKTTIISDYKLNQNYPNPFNPSTKITFTLPKSEHVTLSVYNTLGQKIGTILDTRMNAGSHNVQFDAFNLPSGIYFYHIHVGDVPGRTAEFSRVRKMVLLR